MMIMDARKLGRARGLAVASKTQVDDRFKLDVKCGCAQGELCALCLAWAVNTQEEVNRLRHKAEWSKMLSRFAKSKKETLKIHEAFEEGVIAGIGAGVRKRLKEYRENARGQKAKQKQVAHAVG